jgi:hypothetical protein
MLINEIEGLTLIDMKRVAKDLGIVGYANISTKAKMFERIESKLNELGVLEVPDLEVEEAPVVITKPTFKYIRDYPRIKCIVESRDEQEYDLPIGINEYTCMIRFGQEVEIPEPVYDMIKSLTTIKFIKDDNGFSRSEEIKKYIVSKV